MRKKTLLTLALALCCSGTLTAAFVTAGADESLDYSQVEVLQGISTENISVTDLDGNEVSLAAGPHGGSASKSVFVDGIIHSTQTTLLADSAGNGVVGYVTIDAGREYVVNKLLVDIVHDWGAADFSIELSTDAAFSDPIVIYSNKADEGFTADSDHAVSSVLYNKPMQGLTFEFSPVRARYVRITGNTYGNGQLWGWTCLGEVQMWAVQDTLDVYADLPAGSYEGEQEVSLGSTVEGAEIYYTLDGSVPTTSSTKYERPISVIGEQKIRAVAYANGKYGYPFDFNYFASSASDYEIGVNACLNKSVTAYDTQGNEIYAVAHNGGSSLSVVTDGTMGTDNSIGLANADGSAAVGWVQVDMEQSVWINKVNLTLWHDWVFRSITIQVSDDPTFSEGVTTILCTDIGSWIVSSSLAGSMDPTFDYTAYEWFPHSGNGWEFNFAPVKGRYIRTLNQTGSGSMYNTVITELQAWTCEAPAEDSYEIGVNACLNKSVTAYDNSGNALYWTGLNGGTSLNALVDGVKGTGNAFALSKAEAGAGALGWAQVDMGQSVWINKVDLTIWHDWVFGSIIIQVSDDPTFSEGVTTVLSTDLQGVLIDKALAGSMDSTFDYNQEWIQHSGDGWVFNFAPVKGRYIRTSNMSQQYGFTVLTELQAWTCADPNAKSEYEYESFLSAVVAPETIEVYCGKAADELGLPNELTVKYSDGSEGKISVAWNVSAYNSSEAGEYVITGTATDALDAYGLLGDLAVNVTVKALDTTALDAAILTAGGVEAGKYTASTVNALTNAKTAAEVLVAQSYKTQEEVDAATNAISSAYEALKERGDVAALATLVNTWKNEEGSKYTASAYAAFEEALTAGKNAVAENGNADLEQAQVDKLYETLETTAKALTVRASGSDYAALQTEETRISSAIADEEKITLSGFAKAKALVEKAKAYLEADDELKAETTAEAVQAFTEELAAYAIVYRGSAAQLQEKYNEYKGAYGYSETSSGDYHIESYCVYMDAMYAAEPLFVAGACDDMTQEQIDVYKTALENSVAALVKHADVTALTNAFTNAKALKATDYTSSTYTVFLTVLEEVAPVAAKPANYLLQTEADEALAKLTAGVNALEKLGDKSTIKQLIALYSSEDAADYTSATFEKLETALFAANKVKNSDDVNEKAVKEATEALQAAYEGLHKLGDKTQLKEYLERAKAADTSAMTEEKLAALNAAIEYTQKVVDFEGEVTEAQVEAAKALIDAALAVEEEPSVIDTIKDKVQSVVGGCSAVTGGIGVAAVALGACICALRKKEEK